MCKISYTKQKCPTCGSFMLITELVRGKKELFCSKCIEKELKESGKLFEASEDDNEIFKDTLGIPDDNEADLYIDSIMSKFEED